MMADPARPGGSRGRGPGRAPRSAARHGDGRSEIGVQHVVRTFTEMLARVPERRQAGKDPPGPPVAL